MRRRGHALGALLLEAIMQLLQLLLFGRVPRAKRRAHRRRSDVPPAPSDPQLEVLWLALRQRYFPDRPEIDHYRVVWSGRSQKRVLATCFPTKRLVKVARELREPLYDEWLEPLLYHEMCHAYLGKVANANGRRMWHGPEFRALEARHPGTARLNRWMNNGGWAGAVRRDRARRAALARHAKTGASR